MGSTDQRGTRRVARAAVWLPGLAVALSAAIATAHGLFEVAVAARVPEPIAWLYPLITDGLALVAYAATARLAGSAARYAWTVVVIAAGLSGLAQAAYLAGGPSVEVAPALRFGVGAWPAIAAAVVAHLLYLLATETRLETGTEVPVQGGIVQPGPFIGGVHSDPFTPSVLRADGAGAAEQPDRTAPPLDPASGLGPDRVAPRSAPSPARDRAEQAAIRYAQRVGAWPTVTDLEAAAEVSRGTAAAALKALRERPLPLHLINTRPVDDPDTQNEAQT